MLSLRWLIFMEDAAYEKLVCSGLSNAVSRLHDMALEVILMTDEWVRRRGIIDSLTIASNAKMMKTYTVV
jgi:hypothetical protein